MLILNHLELLNSSTPLFRLFILIFFFFSYSTHYVDTYPTHALFLPNRTSQPIPLPIKSLPPSRSLFLPPLPLQLIDPTDGRLEGRLEPRPPPLTPQPLLLEPLSLVEPLRMVFVLDLLVPAHLVQHAEGDHGRGRRLRRQSVPDEDGAADDGFGAHVGSLEGVFNPVGAAVLGGFVGDDVCDVD